MKRLVCGAILFSVSLVACIPQPEDLPPGVGSVPGPPLPPVTGLQPRLPTVQLPSGVVAPSASWANATGNLANLPSECGNLTLVSADPRSSRIYSGVAQHGLYVSNNGGTMWDALGVGAGSATITNRPTAIVYDPDVPGTFWESGIYNGGGVYRTTDNGDTFVQRGTVGHNDSVSIDMHDPGRQTLVASGHEQPRTLHLSTDGGGTWTNIGNGFPANFSFSSNPLVLDSDSYLIGACDSSGACKLWRTDDAGATWTASASTISPTGTPLWHSSGRIYWQSGNDLAVSGDNGVTWQTAASGIRSPLELPDGRLLGLANGVAAISADGGRVWTAVGQPVPFESIGLAYSPWTKTMFLWHANCGNFVLPNAIASAGFDYQQ